MSVELDTKAFHKRAKALLSFWKKSLNDESDTSFGKADALVFAVGTSDEDVLYQKGPSLQSWLLGYEFTETLMVCTSDDKFYFYASTKKASYLEQLKGGSVDVEILRRSKDEEANAKTLDQLISFISSSGEGKKLGVFPKDKYGGKLITEWKSALEKSGKDFEEVDATVGVAVIMSVKDEDELKTIRVASKVSSAIMQNYFSEEMSRMIDEEKEITHEQFTQKLDKILGENASKFAPRLKFPKDVDVDSLDWCYSPIIQSGGVYDLKPSAFSNEDNLHAGTILCSLGVRYKSYCSNVARTFMIDPTKEQEKNYEFLLKLQDHLMSHIKDGVRAKDIYARAYQFVKTNRPDLEGNFTKNVGFGTGIEFREASFVLNAKNERLLKAGMAINLVIGLQNLENQKTDDQRNKTYALLIADTIRVTNDRPIVFTEDAPKSSDTVFFYFNDDEEEQAEEKKEVKKEPSAPKATAILKSKFRSEEQNDDLSVEARRKEHQKALARQKQEEGLARFAGEDGDQKAADKPVFRRFESYKKETQLPRDTASLKIFIDHKNESIILPMYGLAVPFHISTLKNVSKNDEGEYVYLRLNFITPGQSMGKKDDLPFEDPNATFVKSMTYRSTDTYRMSEIYRQISELKKMSLKREAEKKDLADIVEQDKLVEVRNRRPAVLQDVYVRPSLDGKRHPGDLALHTNGLRFTTPLKAEGVIDILFNNIKHLFFQPCENELIVLLHIHLKNPIMIGKKKTKDVQFYREATDMAFDETGNRRRRPMYGDEDELAQEQEERRKRAQLNREFQSFGAKIVEVSDSKLDVDVPYRDLGFNGVPFRSNVLLQPTADCLVHLTEPPFLIITLADVEVVHLERITFGLKNFDMVFVFKDFTKPPVHINSIPMTQLENVKDWLDSSEIPFSEGPVNLNWSAIMKTINEDPAAFFKEGGWAFLQADSDDEGSDSEDSASEFEMSDEEFAESSSESDEYSEASESESGSAEEDSESGEDWDELEEKAKKQDAKKEGKRSADHDDDERPKKKKK
ncbi:FACT complex component Spt16 [Paraphysoderma sedebokerense]|nr:FACT complex component Spt16 [Paraphysoderma sedebokerense]